MEKIFTSVAVFAVALMVATAGLGLWLGDLHGQTDQAILRWGTVHRLSGILAALVVVLVNSMSVTVLVASVLQVRDDAVVDVFLLLSKILGTDTVESIRGELVITLHVRKHVKDHTSFDGSLNVVSLSVGSTLKGRIPHFRLGIHNSSPL